MSYDPDAFGNEAQDKSIKNEVTKEELKKALDDAKPKTPDELREYFLSSASDIIDEYVNAAMGRGELSGTNIGCREEVWDLVKSLILTSSAKINLNVNSPEAVIKAVQSGECTLEEAQLMLDMYKKVKDISIAGQAPGSGGGPSFVVNIQGGSAEVKQVENEPIPMEEAGNKFGADALYVESQDRNKKAIEEYKGVKEEAPDGRIEEPTDEGVKITDML